MPENITRRVINLSDEDAEKLQHLMKEADKKGEPLVIGSLRILGVVIEKESNPNSTTVQDTKL